MRSHTRGALVLLAVLAVLPACGDTAVPPPPAPDDLTGTTWIVAGWDGEAQAVIHKRTDELVGEVVGYAFRGDGVLVYRSPGWCATRPLTYFDVTGTWDRPDAAHLHVAYPGAVPVGELHYEIVRHTVEELVLRRLETSGP
jgi:hypothetical protein